MSRFLRLLGRVTTRVLVWGLAIVAVLTVLGFVGCSVQVKRAEVRETARRAACTWTDRLVVEVSGQVLAVPATGHSAVTASDGTYLGDEPIDGPGVWPRRYAFCLDTAQTTPIDAIRFSIDFDALKALLEPHGIGPEHVIGLDIWRGGTMTARWPQPEGDPERLFVYRVTAEHGWTHLAAGGVGADGLRTGGECAPTHDDRQSCNLWVEDTVTGLSYAFMSQWIDDRAFDGAPVPEEFRNTALELRALIDSLAADAADPLEAPG